MRSSRPSTRCPERSCLAIDVAPPARGVPGFSGRRARALSRPRPDRWYATKTERRRPPSAFAAHAQDSRPIDDYPHSPCPPGDGGVNKNTRTWTDGLVRPTPTGVVQRDVDWRPQPRGGLSIPEIVIHCTVRCSSATPPSATLGVATPMVCCSNPDALVGFCRRTLLRK